MADRRITETGDVRITETNDVRILEGANDLDATGQIAFTTSADLDAPGRLQATGAITWTTSAIQGFSPSRVTQVVGEVIAEGDASSRVTQVSIDAIIEGDATSRITQVSLDVIADVVAHVDNVRVTQIIVEIIAEPSVIILTTSPLPGGFVDKPYSINIVASGGLGTLTYSLTSGVPGFSDGTISNVTQGNPVVITTAVSNGLVDGQKILITDVLGMVELNGNYYYVGVLSPTAFALYADKALTILVDGTSFTAYISGGIFTPVLPAGLILNTTTGEITGTLTEAGTFTFSVTVTDSVGNFATQTYTIFIDSIAQPAVNLGIGPLGLGYTVQRGFSGVECHFEFTDVGLGTEPFDLVYQRTQMPFPRYSFPDDQNFYLEVVGGNSGNTSVVWTIFDGLGNFQSLTYPANTEGRVRNATPFMGPTGIYLVTVGPAEFTNAARADAVRIVAPLRKAQKFTSEIRLTNANYATTQDQALGAGDVWRTSNAGHEGLDDGWTPAGVVWCYHADAWSNIDDVIVHVVMSTASFGYQSAYKYSEIAIVDIDDIGEFAFSRKVSTQGLGDSVFFTPTSFFIPFNKTSLRDGHRYQIFGRSVHPDGFFSFNTFLNTARIHLVMEPGNSAEIYNRCGSFKRVYMPGAFVPNPEIFFQLAQTSPTETRKLQDLGPSTPAGNFAILGSGTDIDESEVTTEL